MPTENTEKKNMRSKLWRVKGQMREAKDSEWIGLCYDPDWWEDFDRQGYGEANVKEEGYLKDYDVERRVSTKTRLKQT